ncbi:MAG: hypothetical protein ACHQF3_08235 [Alphaproteobacteria bacterium]
MHCRLLGAALAVFLSMTIMVGSARSDGLTFFDRGPVPALLEFSIGAFAPLDPPGENHHGTGATALFQVDGISRWAIVNFWNYFIVNPYIGGFVTGKGGGMGYAGIHGTAPIGSNFEADPFVAVGGYGRGGGRDLGGTAFFQTGLQLLYVFDSGYRAGVTFSHESNGTLLPRESSGCVCNPGANNFLITVGVPIKKLLDF